MSSQVLAASTLLDDILICDVKKIKSVVAMIPRELTLPSGANGEFFCMMEKPGLDISDLGVAYRVYSQPVVDSDEENGNDSESDSDSDDDAADVVDS